MCLTLVLLGPYIYGSSMFQCNRNNTRFDELVFDRFLANPVNSRCLFFININIFRHYKLQMTKNASENNSVGHDLNIKIYKY